MPSSYDIILVNPIKPDHPVPYADTNVGLAVIESYLKDNKISTIVINSTELEAYIDKSEIFAFSVWDYTFSSACSCLSILQDKTVIFGGWSTSYLWKNIMEDNPEVDYIILREGENRLLKLIHLLKNKSDINQIKVSDFQDIDGIVFRDNEKIICQKPQKYMDMNTLPISSERCVLMDTIVFIEVSRGCYGQCGYCQDESVMRYKSANLCIDEIRYWIKEGYDEFYLGNANSLANLKLLYEILSVIDADKKKIFVQLVGRPDDVLRQKETLKEVFSLKHIHIKSLEIGIESDSQQGLNLLGRSTTTEINHEAVTFLQELISSSSYKTQLNLNVILFPHYDASMEDIMTNISFICKYSSLTANSLGFKLIGIAGTPLWHDMVKRGFRMDKDFAYQIMNYPFTDPEVDRFARAFAVNIYKRRKNAITLQDYNNINHGIVTDLMASGPDLRESIRKFSEAAPLKRMELP